MVLLCSRFAQLDLALRSPSLCGSREEEEPLLQTDSGNSLAAGDLSQEAKDLISFISLRWASFRYQAIMRSACTALSLRVSNTPDF